MHMSGFMVDGESLSMVAADGKANMHLLQYMPLRPESGPKGLFHVMFCCCVVVLCCVVLLCFVVLLCYVVL